MHMNLVILFLVALTAPCESSREITYVSSADDTEQPAMFYAPDTVQDAIPLVVALHNWSGDYRHNALKAIEAWCISKGWAYIHPDFRGPNIRPEATGSPLVVQDILSAVDYAMQQTAINTDAVFLVGSSGGGYTALLMAGKHPELWAGVSAWVPISDLRAWYDETKAAGRKYYRDIAASCGGAPGDSTEVDHEYETRSPLTWLSDAKGLRLHINAGIQDGHTGSVPISHALLAFNEVAAQDDRLAADDIHYMVENARVPEHLQQPVADPDYGEKQPLFRRNSGNATITLFDGGHELIPSAAIAWMDSIASAIRTSSVR